ncbi:carbon-nitrogen hydrolase family protein [Paenibacillus abyssi]|uniref:carbon-nitrogen hydrolase family protein n=1 Tax=Paenibacillus abyssi TaxID=1340531 RepID=UPI001E4E7C15|nr:carbon-nitrogen hydrolase family protein [Paenibacillus abyssi]
MVPSQNRIIAAAIQMNCELGRVEANLQKAERLIGTAASRGAQLAVLPELFNTGYRVEKKDGELSESIPGPTAQWMAQQAQKHNMHLVAAILEKGVSAGLVYDTAVVAGPNGILGTYRKTHLWDKENIRFTKGDQFPVIKTGVYNLGMQICYEVGFPEGARILTFKGADIIVYPSAFGKARLYAWDIATRSRALENGAFVIAANRTGVEKGETEFGGHSRIVDPTGTVLAEAAEEDDVIIAELNLSLIHEQRRTIPYLRDFNRSLISSEYNTER